MERIVDRPQQSDMGSGFGHITVSENTSLGEILTWIRQNMKTWGTITIYNDSEVLRCFDYDLYNNNIFYHHLSGWWYNVIVKKVQCEYCFMSEDIDIYI